MTWAFDQELPEGQKLVLLALADHADDEGTCWPGAKRMAEKCGVTRRTVQRRIAALETRGLLQREHRFHEENGGQRSSIVRLALGEGGVTVTQGGDRGNTGGATGVTPGNVRGTTHVRVEDVGPKERERGNSENVPSPLRALLRNVSEHQRGKSLLDWDRVRSACERFADRDHFAEAEAFTHWHIAGNGQNRPIKDVGRAWLNWLKRAPPRGTEKRVGNPRSRVAADIARLDAMKETWAREVR